MARNGSGVYSLPPGSVVSNGDTSDAADINTPLADIEADNNIARPIVAGGTGATSASAALVNLGLTATAAEINALDGITATVDELNILDGVTATAAELNILDGVTATAAEINALDGITAAGAALLDDADAAAQRTTLELGDLAIRDILDQDSFVTESAIRPPSQKSTKNYIAAQLAPQYTSPETTLATSISLAHSIGATPSRFSFVIRCKTTDRGYAVDDEVPITSSETYAGVGDRSAYANDTYIGLEITTTSIRLRDKGGGGAGNITPGSWKVVGRAWT